MFHSFTKFSADFCGYARQLLHVRTLSTRVISRIAQVADIRMTDRAGLSEAAHSAALQSECSFNTVLRFVLFFYRASRKV